MNSEVVAPPALRMLIALLCGLPFVSCGGSSPEVLRLPQPSGEVEAVVQESSGGATTTFVYRIFLLPAGASPAEPWKVGWIAGARRNETGADPKISWGVNLSWLDDDTLVVSFLSARKRRLRTSTVVGDHEIRILLKEGVRDPTAPLGAMELDRPAS